MKPVRDVRHKALISFIKKILDIPYGYSKDELIAFRSRAFTQYPSMLPIIDNFLDLADQSDTDVGLNRPFGPSKGTSRVRKRGVEMHLFDLLRDRRLFPSNSDLANFASRVLPGMTRRRFDKMSKGDIAARIVEYLETLDAKTRERLEASMHDAMQSSEPKRPAVRESFFSKWERIIKKIEFRMSHVPLLPGRLRGAKATNVNRPPVTQKRTPGKFIQRPTA